MEPHLNAIGRIVVLAGAFLVVIGIILIFFDRIPWLGKLPGDISVERENFRFYFPVVTCIVISVLLTGIMWLIRFFS